MGILPEFKEKNYVENSFLKTLLQLGWKVYEQNVKNPEEAKEIKDFNKEGPIYEQAKKLRETFGEVILEEELKDSIKRINPWINCNQIREVINKIKQPNKNSLVEINEEIHQLLLEGTGVRIGHRTSTVRYIDFRNPENNSFIAVSQFKVAVPGTGKHIIPDIVLFVNGLPLVVVECKSPATPDSIIEAITQLMRYSNRRGEKEGNERLFWYNLFSIATIREVAKYGTITAEPEHFVEWKDSYPYTLPNKGTKSQDLLIYGMLSKNNLLDILHTFTIFKDDPKVGLIKIVPRYHQFRAVKRIIERIKEGKTPEEKGGIVWHTQGSGKSLTMLYTVRAIYHDPDLKNYKIVFVTDRRDLEKQLRDTLRNVGYRVEVANSIKDLKEKLRYRTPHIVMGMIHKYQERELEEQFPLLNDAPEILVMIDEAHRSQYKHLGANLRKALPNAVKIAFTGTPIEKTEQAFGKYIDKYSIRQAVEDKVTVEIIYEGRAHNAEIEREDELNEKAVDIMANLDREDKKILGRYTWQAYLENEKVIRHKAKDMIDHYISHIFPNGFKAQVVAVSRKAAVTYKKALEDALKEKIEELKKNNPNNIDIKQLENLKVAVVISGLPNDPPEYHPYTDEREHDRVIKSFKLPFGKSGNDGIDGNVGILVVNEMLITGFDAPIEQVMYLDKPLKEHNLLQAIARVNRVYKDKSVGYVVDYVGIFNHLEEALAIYANEDIEEITQVVKNKAKSIDELHYTRGKIENFFKENGIENWRENIEDCLDLLADEIKRNEFINLVRNFSRALDAIYPDPRALDYVKDLKILSSIKVIARNKYRDDKLSLRDVTEKIRKLLEEHLISKGIDPKIPPTPLLDDRFIENLKGKTSKARAEELKYAIYEHIEKHYEEDPELYDRYSEKLKRILEEYQENWELLAQRLENLRQEIKKGREAEETYGLDPKKEMPFFGLLKREIFGRKPINELSEEDINLLLKLTKEILEIIGDNIKEVDFWSKDFAQKRLRGLIEDELIDKGFFEKRKEITTKLLEFAYHVFGKQFHGN